MIKLFALCTLIMSSLSASALDRALLHKASFDETYDRFPSPYAIIQELRRIAPQSASYETCLQVDKDSAPVLGTIDPLRGESLEKKPGDLFYQYFQDCVHALVKNTFVGRPAEVSQVIFGTQYENLTKLAYTDCMNSKLVNLSCSHFDLTGKIELNAQFWYYAPWLPASQEFKAAMLNGFIDYLAGPDEVLSAQGYIGKETAFGVPLENRAALIALLSKKMDELAKASVAPEFLRMQDVYADIAIILRLGPALKG